jgi:Tol biopolymer transport system component
MRVWLLAVSGFFAVGAGFQAPTGGLPLATPRTIELTLDEGTWLGVDVSPDGKQIVFDLLGDLYLLPFAGGEARRITRGPAWDNQPRFSPDGAWIAFVSDRDGTDNLWLVRPDGTETRAVTRETRFLFGSPAWSPDGQYLAARRGETTLDFNELWLLHRNGGKGIRLTQPEGLTRSVAGPAFSPDGRYVYFSSSPNRHTYNLDLGFWQVRRLDRDGGGMETLTGSYGGGLRPALSPDGRLLAYGSRHDAQTGLWLRDLATGAERWLVYPIDRDEQEGHVCTDLLPGYAFTPDGSALVLSYGGKLYKVDVASGAATLIPFTARVEQQLGPRVQFPRKVEQGPLRVRQLRWPNPSPEGKRLAFGALGKIWIADLPSGRPRRLTESAAREYSPSFSPDGRFIAYVSWSDEEGGHLWKVPAAGGTPERLSRAAAFYHAPAWSPDGGKIVFLMGSARAWLAQDASDLPQIRWIPAAGGESRRVIDSPLSLPVRGTPVQRPLFSGDGERIRFVEHQAPVPAARGQSGAIVLR